MARDVFLQIRLSEVERLRVREDAAGVGVGVTAWVRRCLGLPDTGAPVTTPGKSVTTGDVVSAGGLSGRLGRAREVLASVEEKRSVVAPVSSAGDASAKALASAEVSPIGRCPRPDHGVLLVNRARKRCLRCGQDLRF